MITVNKTIGTLVSLMIGFIGFMFVSARRRNVIHHSLDIVGEELQGKSLSVFFISDIHRRKIDDKLLAKVQTVRAIDIVIIGGDLAESGVPLTRIAENIRKLAQLGPVFYIWGNNDREAGEQEIRDIITRNGGKVLDNENVTIPGHPSWGIAGTDDPSSGNVDIDAALRYIDKYENVIFVTHTPSLFRKVEQMYQPRIMLAGHTHGGQIRFGKFGLQEKGTFRKENGRAKLISNGYGTTTLPLRLGAPPECHVIAIRYV
ncbi:metallophosphoesterase [Sporosarcina sp. JAI121]|uniref:metallophosphoesterase n=1 Tax=Sporosarcina sp. JAI121 TaxID=2723064 RepID=UPI0015CEB2EE|nr:metallophosphoesterase [Sporosarcina sp. JAI121]NYF24482.1 putative MPP superfamily phosphohydrolase [Sporosarcina sp. JAI121]